MEKIKKFCLTHISMDKSGYSRESDISIGEKFPPLELETTKGSLRLPNYFANKWFILFSHPKDFTPVCTLEYVQFAKKFSSFNELNCGVVGLSLDSLKSHEDWIKDLSDKYDVEIPYPIISDENSSISLKLGILNKKNDITNRSVIFVDTNGIIRSILHYPPEISRSVNEIIRVLNELQKCDEKKDM